MSPEEVREAVAASLGKALAGAPVVVRGEDCALLEVTFTGDDYVEVTARHTCGVDLARYRVQLVGLPS